MTFFRRPKTPLDQLKIRYAELMKKAFHLALKDKRKSDSLNEEARKLLIRIKDIEGKAA